MPTPSWRDGRRVRQPTLEWGRGKLPAPVEEASTTVAQRELLIYWSYVHTQTVHLSKEGLLRKRLVRLINERLLLPDPTVAAMSSEKDSARLHFMRLLLQELGVLVEQNHELRANDVPGRVPEFWLFPHLVRVRACLDAWMRMKGWSELSSLRLSSFDLDLPGARHRLLQELRKLPTMVWLAADRFLNRLVDEVPPLLFASQELGRSRPVVAGWSTYQEASSAVGSHNGRLGEIEAAFVGSALSGPLHWLGVLDVCSDGNRLLAFRISASGARALSLAQDDDSATGNEARLIVQPNFRIFALGPISETILAHIELFADRVKAGEASFEYVLSRATVYSAQQQGVSVEQIVAFLAQNSSLPVPTNVHRTLLEWGRQHERIVVHRTVSLCEVMEPELLEQLWEDGSLRIHLEKRLAPTVAVVRRGQTSALQEALLQHGILPAVSPADAPCTNRVLMMPDGELRPTHSGPDLLLVACLRRLTQERRGSYYVNEEAVKTAMARGTTVLEYLDQLKSVHHGPLPSEYQSRIKAWGGYYGKAHLRQAILLEVRDASTADELLAEPELATLLSRFPGDPSSRLLLVHTDDHERLRGVLAAHGVELV